MALWLLTLALLAAFAVIARDVYLHHPLALDASVLKAMHRAATPARTALARDLSRIGEPDVLGPITAALVVALAVLRRGRWAALLTLEVGGAAALDLVGKPIFGRPRPELYPHLVRETNFSFPSGHAMGGLAFFLALHLLLWHALPRAWRWVGVLDLLLALAIGASRPYLQVHFPSDVLAGWAFGAGWVLLVHLLFHRPDRS